MFIPAVCDNCGTLFPSGFAGSGNAQVSVSGCTSGPCPKCGSMGHIPDGVYNFIGNTIQLLSGPKLTIFKLVSLEKILTKAKQEHSPIEEVTEKIEEELPDFSKIIDFLPKSRVELYAFITIILMIVQLLMGQLNRSQKPNITINQVINLLYEKDVSKENEKITGESKVVPQEFSIRKREKIGRNSPCPCGSGKKYKKCCLGKRK